MSFFPLLSDCPFPCYKCEPGSMCDERVLSLGGLSLRLHVYDDLTDYSALHFFCLHAFLHIVSMDYCI